MSDDLFEEKVFYTLEGKARNGWHHVGGPYDSTRGIKGKITVVKRRRRQYSEFRVKVWKHAGFEALPDKYKYNEKF